MESERFVDKEKGPCVCVCVCVCLGGGGGGGVSRDAKTEGIESERRVDKRRKKKIVKSGQV